MTPRKEWCAFVPYLEQDAQVEVITYISAFPDGRVHMKSEQAKAFINIIKPMMEIECGRKVRVKNFQKPTYEEVYDYFVEHYEGNYFDFDPRAFVDFYESKGWVVGRSPMKDWHRAISTWRKNKPSLTKEQWLARYGKDSATTGENVDIGEGEVIINGVRRYYINGTNNLADIIVPMDAPKRPNRMYRYSPATNNWYFQP